jgi:hypothetical protein
MMSLTSHAEVPTEKPHDYIIRLCKHFAHKIPATYDDTSGVIEFDMGVCRLKARDDTLFLEVEGADAEAIERLEGVVTRHLARFAWKEEPVIDWVRGF